MFRKDEILHRTNKGLEVFRHYVSGEWRVGRNFLNPLYEDRKASCNIYFDRNANCYRLKDFGNDECSGDCFSFVGQLNKLDCRNPKDFVEILQIINRDLSLGLDGNEYDSVPSIPKVTKPAPQPESVTEPKKSKPYRVVQQVFSSKELAFWSQYGITAEVLKSYKVASLKEFKSENSEGKPFNFTSSEQEPIFGYVGKQHVKIYRPFSQVRFLYGGNVESYCFGLEQLPAKGDTLFITGGEKDVMSLSARGFNAICFNSETAHIPQGIIRKLSYMFKHIVLLYDMDKTGQEASLKHQQQLAAFSVKRLLLPLPGTKEAKDVSDFFG